MNIHKHSPQHISSDRRDSGGSKKKKIGALLLFILFISAGILFFIGHTRIANFISQRIILSLQASDVYITIKDPQISVLKSGFKLSSKNTSFFFKKILFPLEFSDITVTSSFFNFFSLTHFFNPRLYINGNAYLGTVSITSLEASTSSTRIASFDIKNINLSNHPLISYLGITDGLLSVEGRNIVIDEEIPQQGNVKISLEKLKKGATTFFFDEALKQYISLHASSPLLSTMLSTMKEIQLPMFDNVSIQVVATMKNGCIAFEESYLKTPIGEVTFLGIIPMYGIIQEKPPNANEPVTTSNDKNVCTEKTVLFNGRATLTELGQQKLGHFLPLISNNTLSSTHKKFSFTYKLTPDANGFEADLRNERETTSQKIPPQKKASLFFTPLVK
jgi:hypothetical protein